MAVSPVTLRDALAKSFNLGELNTLCFELGIVYENLGGQGLEAKALSLVQYVQRHGLYDRLVASVQQARPHLDLTAVGTEGSSTVPTQSTQPAGQTGHTYNFYGPVTGSAVGEGSVQAHNIAGRDVNITNNYAEPTNKAEFAAQLAQLEALLKEAVASGEIEDDSAVEDVKDAIEEAQKPEPSSRRLKNRLEDVKEILEGTGGLADAARKAGTAAFKAITVISGLIKVVTTIF